MILLRLGAFLREVSLLLAVKAFDFLFIVWTLLKLVLSTICFIVEPLLFNFRIGTFLLLGRRITTFEESITNASSVVLDVLRHSSSSFK